MRPDYSYMLRPREELLFATADGKTYAPQFPRPSAPQYGRPCEYCDLQGKCNEWVCGLWRERATSGFTYLSLIYWKEDGKEL